MSFANAALLPSAQLVSFEPDWLKSGPTDRFGLIPQVGWMDHSCVVGPDLGLWALPHPPLESSVYPIARPPPQADVPWGVPGSSKDEARTRLALDLQLLEQLLSFPQRHHFNCD